MQSNFLTEILVPLSLMFVMFGLGLSLTVKDFTRLTENPRAVILGTLGHFVVLPLIGVLCIIIFDPKPEFAVGLMLLVACGGGVVSNALTLIANGNTALSITLTSISLPASIITIPLITNSAIQYFLGESREISLPVLDTFVRLVLSLWVPIIIGMILKYYLPGFARAMDRPIRIFSMLFITALTVSIMVSEQGRLVEALLALGPITFTLNALAILFGLIVSRLIGLAYKESITIGIELGIQNSATALFVALSVLSAPEIAIPPAIYTLIAFINVGIFIVCVKNSKLFYKSA